MRLPFLCLTLAALAACTQSPPPTATGELGDALLGVLDQHPVPGLVAARLDSTDGVALGAAGFRSRPDYVPVALDDPFHLGSNTKSMTASVFARLVEDGVLDWDDTLTELLGDVTMHPSFQDVTLPTVLAHRGGFWTSISAHDPELADLPEDAALPEQRRFVAEVALGAMPEVEPGTETAYSNIGYVVVAAALEQVTGASWEELIAQELFEPLGMSSCGFGAPNAADPSAVPWGHRGRGSGIHPDHVASDNPLWTAPAGGVHCSMADWARYAEAHLEPGLLTKSSLDRLHDYNGQDLALGWDRLVAGSGEPVLQHFGSNTLWMAFVAVLPESDRGLLVACNQGDDEGLDAVLAAASALEP